MAGMQKFIKKVEPPTGNHDPWEYEDKGTGSYLCKVKPVCGQEKSPALFDYPGFAATIFLDPRFFTVLEEKEVTAAKTFIQNLHGSLQQKKNRNQDEPAEEENEVDDNIEPDDEILTMLQERDSTRVQTATFTSIELCTELYKFYRETPLKKTRKKPILQWCEENKLKWPTLYLMAQILHYIPATQVSVERLFSSLKFKMHHLRSGLEDCIIDDLVGILNNSHLVKEDILLLINNVADNDDEESE